MKKKGTERQAGAKVAGERPEAPKSKFGPVYISSDNAQMASLAKPGLDQMDVFALISKWALKVEKGGGSDADFFVRQISGVASRAMQEVVRMAFKGNETAARQLHVILASNVFSFDELCHQNPALFETIARKTMGWPAMISCLSDVKKRNKELEKTLNLGRDVRINIDGKQASQEKAEVEAALWLRGTMEIWRDGQSPERVKEQRAILRQANKELGRPANYQPKINANQIKWPTQKAENESRLREESFKLAKNLQPLNRQNYKEWFAASWLLFRSRYGDDFENRKCFANYQRSEAFKEPDPDDERKKRLVKNARALIRDAIKKKIKLAFRSIAPKNPKVG
jgi:hypothetical protein